MDKISRLMKTLKKVLHVGCGNKNNTLPDIYKDYQEIRLDIDSNVEPDICCSITNIPNYINENTYDSIYSQHNLEHLHQFDIIPTLAGFRKVLNNNGFVYIRVPDIETVANLIINGKLNEIAYESPAGPIRTIDIIYGYGRFTYKSNNDFMYHKSAFTVDTLIGSLREVGFYQVTGRRLEFDIEVVGTKTEEIDIKDILMKI